MLKTEKTTVPGRSVAVMDWRRCEQDLRENARRGERERCRFCGGTGVICCEDGGEVCRVCEGGGRICADSE